MDGRTLGNPQANSHPPVFHAPSLGDTIALASAGTACYILIVRTMVVDWTALGLVAIGVSALTLLSGYANGTRPASTNAEAPTSPKESIEAAGYEQSDRSEAEAAPDEQVNPATLVSQGIAHGMLGRPDMEIAAYDEVVRRFGEVPDSALREQAAMALTHKGMRLEKLGRLEDAVATNDEVVSRFGDAPEAGLRQQVAMALVSKAERFERLWRLEEAVAVYDEVVSRFGDAPEAGLRQEVAMALLSKAGRLRNLGRLEEAVAVYDEVVCRFGEAPEVALRRYRDAPEADLRELAVLRRPRSQ
jgi:tetratricopeptide (TPR) repeat protein